MTYYNENENVENIRQQGQPKKANEIKRAMNIGFHLKCLRCGAAYYHTEFAMSEMSYRMYSYCPECIDKAIEALKEQDPIKPIVDVDTRSNRSMRGGRSYRRGYSREGYSRDGGMVDELRELMQDAPDERTKQEFQRFIDKIERM